MQYAVRAVSEDGGNIVTGVQVSTDGGKTFGATIGQTTPGTPTFAIGNGLSVNWAAGTFNAGQIANGTNSDAYFFNAVAANQTTQVLQTADATMVGGAQNMMTAAVTAMQSTAANLTGANNTIMDANIAQETVNLTAQKIIQQEAQAMLQQAIQIPNYYLRLYGINVSS